MPSLSSTLIPPSQRQSSDELLGLLDLARGDVAGKRTGFFIMLVLSGVIAVAGVLADSTATVIGAMIIAPLGTPILGIAAGIVTGVPGLIARSFLWLLAGAVIVVVIGVALSALVFDTSAVDTNSQIVGRTSPGVVDLIAALATGTAGAFAMCRKDLSAVLPGVAIAISLVPPLGVVGVCAGVGAWNEAFGALFLFLSNVVSLVIAGSIVFTVAGYHRDPSSVPTANRRRAYIVVGVLSAIIVLPLAANTALAVVIAGWTQTVRQTTVQWLEDDATARVGGITWTGVEATVQVTTGDGTVPAGTSLADELADRLPPFVAVELDVSRAVEHPVLPVE